MKYASDIKDRVIALLWEGNRDGARKLVEEESSRLQQEADQLKSLLPNGSIASASHAKNGTEVTHPSDLDDDEKVKRRKKVLMVAKSVKTTPAGSFKVDDIAQALKDENYDLGVIDSRITTAISNILRHSKQYRKIRKGLYQPKQIHN